MKRFLLVLVALCLSSWSMAQSDLPACQGTDTIKWDQCIGSETFNVDGKMVSRYTGEYANGSFHGQGAMTFASGLRFVGNFKAGHREGEGVEYNKDGGVIRSGNWEGPLNRAWPIEKNRYPFNWEANLVSTASAFGDTARNKLESSSLAPVTNVSYPDIGKCPVNFRLSFTDGNQACLTDFGLSDALLTGTNITIKNSLDFRSGSLHITTGNASCPALISYFAMGTTATFTISPLARGESKQRCQRLLADQGVKETPDCQCTELVANGSVAMTRDGLRSLDARWARPSTPPSPMAALSPSVPTSLATASLPTLPNLPANRPAHGQQTGQDPQKSEPLFVAPVTNVSYPDIGKCPVNFRLSFTDGNQACLTDFGLADAVLTGTQKTVKNSLDSRPSSMHITTVNASCPALISYFALARGTGGGLNLPLLQGESKQRCQRLLADQGIKETPECQCTELITNGSVAMTRDGLRNLDARWARPSTQSSPIAALSPSVPPTASLPTPPNLPDNRPAQGQQTGQDPQKSEPLSVGSVTNVSYPDIGKCPMNFRLSFTDGSQACLTDFGLSDAVLTGSQKTIKNSLDSRQSSLFITTGSASCPALISYFVVNPSWSSEINPRVRGESKKLCQRLLSDQGVKETPDCQCTELITNGSVAMTRDGLRSLDARWARPSAPPSPMAAPSLPTPPNALPAVLPTPPNLPDNRQSENLKTAQELAQLEQRVQQERSDRLRELADATQAKRELEDRLRSEAALRQQERQARESSEQNIKLDKAERDRLAAENARLRAELEAARQTNVKPNMAFRKALVIGIDNYKHIARLATAREDAQAMARSLTTAGFTVSQYLDIGEKDMRAALRKFAAEVEGGDEVAFFFAGHGVQLGGLNYLIPMDVSGESEGQLREDAIPLQRILDDMNDRKAKLTLAVIDACRDNPFRVAGRNIGNVSRGLSPTTPATGQIVIFSAGTGQRALDTLGPQDKDRNGVFTRVFAQEIRKRGVTIDQVARTARTEVVRLARSIGHEQVPAIYDQLVGEFILMK
jgi:hypothetical protein